MVSSVLLNMSQVEHAKKHNGIDSENMSVKRNAGHQNCLISMCYSSTNVQ